MYRPAHDAIYLDLSALETLIARRGGENDDIWKLASN